MNTNVWLRQTWSDLNDPHHVVLPWVMGVCCVWAGNHAWGKTTHHLPLFHPVQLRMNSGLVAKPHWGRLLGQQWHHWSNKYKCFSFLMLIGSMKSESVGSTHQCFNSCINTVYPLHGVLELKLFAYLQYKWHCHPHILAKSNHLWTNRSPNSPETLFPQMQHGSIIPLSLADYSSRRNLISLTLIWPFIYLALCSSWPLKMPAMCNYCWNAEQKPSRVSVLDSVWPRRSWN